MTAPKRAPLSFCMLCAEMGYLRQAKYDARLFNQHKRVYVCEMHQRTHAHPGRPL